MYNEPQYKPRVSGIISFASIVASVSIVAVGAYVRSVSHVLSLWPLWASPVSSFGNTGGEDMDIENCRPRDGPLLDSVSLVTFCNFFDAGCPVTLAVLRLLGVVGDRSAASALAFPLGGMRASTTCLVIQHRM
jgi:hypothetical protein